MSDLKVLPVDNSLKHLRCPVPHLRCPAQRSRGDLTLFCLHKPNEYAESRVFTGFPRQCFTYLTSAMSGKFDDWIGPCFNAFDILLALKDGDSYGAAR